MKETSIEDSLKLAINHLRQARAALIDAAWKMQDEGTNGLAHPDINEPLEDIPTLVLSGEVFSLWYQVDFLRGRAHKVRKEYQKLQSNLD